MSVFLVTGVGIKRTGWLWCKRTFLADLVEAGSEDEALVLAHSDPDVADLESVRFKVEGEVFREDLLRLAVSARSSEASDGVVEAE